MTKSEALQFIAGLPDDAQVDVARSVEKEIENEKNKLLSDIEKAYNQALGYGAIGSSNRFQIVDTFGCPHVRALFYIKGVCERFVAKHKDLHML